MLGLAQAIASLLNHALSVLVFVVALLLFIAVKSYGNSIFFLFMAIALLDFMAGLVIASVASRRVASRRDLAFGRSESLGGKRPLPPSSSAHRRRARERERDALVVAIELTLVRLQRDDRRAAGLHATPGGPHGKWCARRQQRSCAGQRDARRAVAEPRALANGCESEPRVDYNPCS